MQKDFIFTSESVSEGHPDKMADQVSDAVLDAILTQDKHARVACETLLTTGLCVIAGEITTSAVIDFNTVARQTIKRIGYDSSEVGFDYNTCAVHGHRRQAVARHRAGRERGRGHVPRPGRRRPGPDVRLRLQRNPGADADADPPRAPPDRAPVRTAQGRPPAVAAPGRQIAGVDPLRRRQAAFHRHRRALDPAPSRSLARRADRGGDRGDHQAGGAEGHADRRHALSGQPHRALRGGRADGRRRPHRPQDHRRHLRRRGPARRRRVLRQGSVQGRPFGVLRRPLRGEEHRRRGSRRQVPGAGELRHRRRQADLADGRHLRHRQDPRSQDRRTDPEALRPASQGHHPDARPAAADLFTAPRATATSAATSRTSPGKPPTRRPN
jgi:hypothetical protein